MRLFHREPGPIGRLGLAIFLLLAMPAQPAGARTRAVNIGYHRFGRLPVVVITVDLNDPDVKVTPTISRWGVGTAETHSSMIHRTAPTAAITGAFFDPRSHIPTGDIVIQGRLVHFGGIGQGLAITAANHACIVRRTINRHVNWSAYDSVLCAGPRVLWGGSIYADPRMEGFRDRKFWRSLPRLGAGITGHNKLLLAYVRGPVTLSGLGRVMRKLGALDAVDLDQGSSTCLYYRGRLLARPGRTLSNLLLVYDSQDRFRRVIARVAPWAVASGARGSQPG